jgi:hypothetical protein
MAIPIRIKRSAVPGKRPTINDLQLGELALNTYDADLFTLRSRSGIGSDVVTLGAGATVTNILYVTKDGSDINTGKKLGDAKATIKGAVAIASPGSVIKVSAGTYIENNPITLPNQVSIVGDSLREVTITPQNTGDLFYVGNGNYIAEMSFVGAANTGAIFSFDPIAIRYFNQSPYIQNCTNFIQNSIGLRIDGNLCSNSSPLRSFVADAFTQVNQGGPGHLVINDGYTQFVSCFTTFCTYGFKVANGGFANVSNSVIDFGKYGLISKKYYPESYNTATAAEDKSSTVVKIEIQNSGSGYTPNDTNIGVIIFNGTSGPSALDATAHAIADEFGSIKEIIIDTPGAGYIAKPNVSIDAPVSGITATTIGGKASISNVNNILINVK